MQGGRPEDGGRPDGASERSAARARRLLFVCADPVGEEMAGLGIRCWELARVLAGRSAVTVAHGGKQRGRHGGVELVPYRPHAPGALRQLIAQADMVVAHPQWPLVDRWLRRARARVVTDLYCPETLETLELFADASARMRAQMVATTLDRLHSALRAAHNVICASETQRDLWLGAMLALRLVGPELYDRDPSLREVIELVPFGVPAEPPDTHAGGGPREVLSGVGEDSEIVLWNGGIWRWLDAQSAIRAVAALAASRPSLRLVFMGAAARHPAARASAEQAHALARDLGVLGSTVHFHDGWVPYAHRGAWLAQAACVISAHADHLESRFAYRTRLLDCLWAGVPVVCSTGDDLADRVERERLGATAAPGDPEALAAALEQVLEQGREAYAPRLREAASRQSWERVSEPLRRWLDAPTPAQRLGERRGALRPPLAQQARAAAYLAGGRALLARR